MMAMNNPYQSYQTKLGEYSITRRININAL